MPEPEEVHLRLLPSLGDEPDWQDDLLRFYAQLLDANIEVVPRWKGDAVCRSYSDSDVFKHLGEFAVPLAQIVSPALIALVRGWFARGTGRKVRLKVGDIEAEARTVEELDELLHRARAFQAGKAGANDEA